MALITIDEFKTYAGINSPNKDEQINPLLEPATEMIQGYLKIEFTSEDISTPLPKRVVEKFLTDSLQQEYLLPDMDVDVLSVTLTGIQGRGAPELEDGDWFVDTRLGKLTFFVDMSSPYYCDVEYDTTSSPTEAIKLATCMLVNYWLQQDFNSAIAGAGQSVTYTPVRVLPKHIENILNIHRIL
ncbi:head-tail adaptor [Vibrio phage D239]